MERSIDDDAIEIVKTYLIYCAHENRIDKLKEAGFTDEDLNVYKGNFNIEKVNISKNTWDKMLSAERIYNTSQFKCCKQNLIFLIRFFRMLKDKIEAYLHAKIECHFLLEKGDQNDNYKKHFLNLFCKFVLFDNNRKVTAIIFETPIDNSSLNAFVNDSTSSFSNSVKLLVPSVPEDCDYDISRKYEDEFSEAKQEALRDIRWSNNLTYFTLDNIVNYAIYYFLSNDYFD